MSGVSFAVYGKAFVYKKTVWCLEPLPTGAAGEDRGGGGGWLEHSDTGPFLIA